MTIMQRSSSSFSAALAGPCRPEWRGDSGEPPSAAARGVRAGPAVVTCWNTRATACAARGRGHNQQTTKSVCRLQQACTPLIVEGRGAL